MVWIGHENFIYGLAGTLKNLTLRNSIIKVLSTNSAEDCTVGEIETGQNGNRWFQITRVWGFRGFGGKRRE